MNIEAKHRVATKLAASQKNNYPLHPDISGAYKYQARGNKYIPTYKSQYSKVKQVHSIVIGTYKPVVFVNHKDYSKIMVDYISYDDDNILFRYNNTNYILPIDLKTGEEIQVKKLN